MKEAEGRYGDAEPVYVRFSPEARELVNPMCRFSAQELSQLQRAVPGSVVE
jgi:hypothetical protein